MHQLLEKIIILAKICGNNILAISYRLSAIVITLTKKSYLKLKQYCSAIAKVIKSKWPFIKDRLDQYYFLMRLDKPVGILLLLWPTLWALWIAGDGHPDLDMLIIFIFHVEKKLNW